MADADPFSHVHPSMRDLLSINGRGRMDDWPGRVWVHTVQTRSLFTCLNDCVNAGESSKPSGVIVYGDPDTGKSHALARFRADHPPKLDAESGYLQTPVVSLVAADLPSRTIILKDILKQLGRPQVYNPPEEELRLAVEELFVKCGVRVLIIDEIGDIAREHASNRAILLLRFLKSMVNRTGRPLVVAGAPSVLDLFARESGNASRARTEFRFDAYTTADAFGRLLIAFGGLVPLRHASDMRDERIGLHLASASEGYIGRLVHYLVDVCRAAIENGDERITIELLRKVVPRSVGRSGM